MKLKDMLVLGMEREKYPSGHLTVEIRDMLSLNERVEIERKLHVLFKANEIKAIEKDNESTE